MREGAFRRDQFPLGQPVNPLHILRVELTANLSTGGSATAKLVDLEGDNDEGTYDRGSAEIEIYDSLKRCLGFGPVSPNQTGERLQVFWSAQSRRYEVLGEHGLHRRAKTTATHAVDTTQNVTIWTGAKGAEVSTGVTVSARNVYHELTGSGVWCHVQADYDGDDIVWYLIAGKCT